MSRGKFEVRGKFKTIVDHTTIICDKVLDHSSYISPNGNCAACAHMWLSSLPFYNPYKHEDDLLKVEFRITDNVVWRKSIIKEVWDSEGEEWRDYTMELFGYQLMEVEHANTYPYWRIQDEENPNLVIPLVRTRICYEPQKVWTPIFLELQYKGFHVTSAIRGMDSDVEIGTHELQYLLTARNRIFDLNSPALPNTKRGGRRNVKVADLPEITKKALGKRYVELRDSLTNVKRDAKAYASATNDWQRLVLNKYPILENHPDLLDQIDPYPVPSDADASAKILAPWEIAIEIAGRENIPNYDYSGVSSDSLKRAAILPNKDEASPAFKR